MISKTTAAHVLEKALELGADFAELYLEDGEALHINYNESVKDISKTHTFGVGLYLIKGTQSVYVYSNDLSERGLMTLCASGGDLLRAQKGYKTGVPQFVTPDVPEPNPVLTRPGTVRHSEKIRLLAECSGIAKGAGTDVVNAEVGYFDTEKRVIICNSEGVWTEDQRTACQLRLTPTVSNGRDSIGYFVQVTKARGFELFGAFDLEMFCLDAIKNMRITLNAGEAPNGRFPVVIAPGNNSGMFFHECCGHQLETNDELINGGMFNGKLGTRIASEKVTLIDDGSAPGMFGSSRFDDEGMPRQKNVLIENGILKSYLVNRMGSIKLKVPRNGSGRRQNYTQAPAARMSNTYIAAGNDNIQDMIRTMHEGLYVTHMGGGFGGADFTLAAHTAYWVKNGQIDRPVKNAILMGRGDESLMKIDCVGNDLILEETGSNCGGASGLCDVSTSGASIRISEMLIGGKGGAN